MRLITASAVIVSALAFGSAVAQPTAPAYMPVGARLAPPKGFLDFCEHAPLECSDEGAERPEIILKRVQAARHSVWTLAFQATREYGPADITGDRALISADPNTLALLRKVNERVNDSIRPLADAPGADIWRTAPDMAAGWVGDCEDFVLQKRRELIAAGLDPRAMSIATGHTAKGEDHAVLVVATDVGDLVLDNRNGALLPWARVQLWWEMRQSGEHPLEWRAAGRSLEKPRDFALNRKVAQGAEDFAGFIGRVAFARRSASLSRQGTAATE